MRFAASSTISPTTSRSGDPAELLTRWREELERVYGGTPTRPISRALADNVRRFNIPRRYFEEIIDGVEMDLTRTRYATFEELRLYCYRVASAVGLICIEIFGYRNPAHARLRGKTRHRISAHQHHARRERGRRPRPHLSAAGRPRALRRHRGGNSAAASTAGASPPDGVRGRARALVLSRGRAGAAGRGSLLAGCAEAMR